MREWLEVRGGRSLLDAVVACILTLPGLVPGAHAADEPVKPAVFDEVVIRTKPRVMIDPGHGGLDPGAVGRSRTVEKNIVLAVAKQLKATLLAKGRYDVTLTRESDVFIPLVKRVQMSVEADADIFISLHADAIDDPSLAHAIRGSSVYTLSDKASDEQARLMAEKENAADLAAGVDVAAGDRGDEIKGILFDLMARETATFSHMLSRLIVGSLGKTGVLAREPERAASFVVLKQSHAPAVLIELGFLSNPSEEQAMTQGAWQQQIAGSIATAIDTYFERKHAATTAAPMGITTGGLPP
jgi:N-acetylmuramoyl-L-alanine amidase